MTDVEKRARIIYGRWLSIRDSRTFCDALAVASQQLVDEEKANIERENYFNSCRDLESILTSPVLLASVTSGNVIDFIRQLGKPISIEYGIDRSFDKFSIEKIYIYVERYFGYSGISTWIESYKRVVVTVHRKGWWILSVCHPKDKNYSAKFCKITKNDHAISIVEEVSNTTVWKGIFIDSRWTALEFD